MDLVALKAREGVKLRGVARPTIPWVASYVPRKERRDLKALIWVGLKCGPISLMQQPRWIGSSRNLVPISCVSIINECALLHMDPSIFLYF